MINRNIIKIVSTFLFILFMNIYSPLKLEHIGYFDKIWGHRTNSIEKLKFGANFYRGIELDLVFIESENRFDVNHPPQTSINLPFSEYLNFIETNKKYRPKLWLDIKNFNDNNSNKILEQLLFLTKKYNYKNENIIVESTKPKGLLKFLEHHFRTSYYLPNSLYTLNKEELKKQLSLIKHNLTDKNLELSFKFDNYKIIKQHFPDRAKNTWALSRLTILKTLQIREMLADPTIKTVLTRYHSFKGNR